MARRHGWRGRANAGALSLGDISQKATKNGLPLPRATRDGPEPDASLNNFRSARCQPDDQVQSRLSTVEHGRSRRFSGSSVLVESRKSRAIKRHIKRLTGYRGIGWHGGFGLGGCVRTFSSHFFDSRHEASARRPCVVACCKGEVRQCFSRPIRTVEAVQISKIGAYALTRGRRWWATHNPRWSQHPQSRAGLSVHCGITPAHESLRDSQQPNTFARNPRDVADRIRR